MAIGALMGRTAVASGEAFAVGAVALVTLLACHTAATYGRYWGPVAKLADHRVRVLVAHGRIRHRELVLCGLTENDFLAQLRQRGVGDLGQLRYVLFETKGELTLVREAEGPAELVRLGLEDAAGWPAPGA